MYFVSEGEKFSEVLNSVDLWPVKLPTQILMSKINLWEYIFHTIKLLVSSDFLRDISIPENPESNYEDQDTEKLIDIIKVYLVENNIDKNDE